MEAPFVQSITYISKYCLQVFRYCIRKHRKVKKKNNKLHAKPEKWDLSGYCTEPFGLRGNFCSSVRVIVFWLRHLAAAKLGRLQGQSRFSNHWSA